jgi:LAGLIDADG-like domain
MREVSIEYIAGLFDGEGCVTWQSRNSKNNYSPVPYCKIQMTDHEVLECVYLTLKKHNVGTYMKVMFPPSSQKSNRQPQTHLVWAGALRTRALLELLLPYLITKRKQAILLLTYIYSRHLSLIGHGSRLIRDNKTGRYLKGGTSPLTEEEKELLDYIRVLNKDGFQIPNEHTLNSIEKMCSGLYRKYTEAAEMTARLEKGL